MAPLRRHMPADYVYMDECFGASRPFDNILVISDICRHVLEMTERCILQCTDIVECFEIQIQQ